MTGHGLFMINGRRVTSPSYRVREGDQISVRERSKSSPLFASVVTEHDKYLPPGWLKVNTGTLNAEVVKLPTAEEAEQAIFPLSLCTSFRKKSVSLHSV